MLVETSKESRLTVGRRSRDLRRLSRDRSATFFKMLPYLLKRRNKIVWQSADDRVTIRRLSRDRSATFFKIMSFWLKRRKKLFRSRPTVFFSKHYLLITYSKYMPRDYLHRVTSANVAQLTDQRLSLYPNFLSNAFRIRLRMSFSF